MKKIMAIVLGLVMVLALSSSAHAEDAAKYNFASAQDTKQIKVVPGEEGSGTIYFYNIDGNRITHIVLEVVQAPDGWEVEIQPPLGETRVEIGGSIVTVTENLYIEPSDLLLDEPEQVPEGTVSMVVPGRGYAVAKTATVVVRVPESEEPGTKGDIVISALAKWLGQTGAAAITQSRDFDFSVEVVTGMSGTEERILTDSPVENEPADMEAGGEELPETGGEAVPEGQETDTAQQEQDNVEASPETVSALEATPAEPETTAQDESGSLIDRWLPVIIACVIVLLAAIIVPLYIRRRHG